ncbi:U-box domain-containing protein 43 [Hordeum vulgare]|nr:U-box domain-containing protein 43 [Hordeum vulgare]
MWLLEGIAGVLTRFTVPWDKKLQSLAVGHGVVPWLVKLLSEGSVKAKSKSSDIPGSIVTEFSATTALSKALSACKSWRRQPLVQITRRRRARSRWRCWSTGYPRAGRDLENGSRAIEKASGIHALLRVAEAGELTSQDKAIWILERIFRLEEHREQYGGIVQALLIISPERRPCPETDDRQDPCSFSYCKHSPPTFKHSRCALTVMRLNDLGGTGAP